MLQHAIALAKPENPAVTATDPSSRDVRMRGFQQRSSFAAALAWLDAWLDGSATRHAGQTPQLVDLAQCVGRILATDVVSSYDVPQFAKAMMDGYAVQAAAVAGAAAAAWRVLEEIGVCLPGSGFDGAVAGQSAVRIMTGAPLPPGADAVLPVEQTRREEGRLLAVASVAAGKHVGRVGEDIVAGETVLRRGRRLRPQDAGLLSSLGVADIPVVPAPQVAICVTGDELLPMGAPPRGYRFADSNGPMLRGLVERDGGRVVLQCQARDDREALRAVMHTGADVLLVTGGSSVGQEDHAPVVLAEEGELAIHGIEMRPGRPTGLGCLRETLVVLLPGNPISCLCGYDFFAGRAIRRLGGRPLAWPYRAVAGTMARDLPSQPGRVEYARVALDGVRVEPLAISGSSLLSTATRADGFLVVPAERAGLAAGEEVEVWLYD